MKITYAIFKLVTKELLEPNKDSYSREDYYSSDVPIMEQFIDYNTSSDKAIYDYATHEEAVEALQSLYDEFQKSNRGQYVILPLYNIG